MIAKTILQPFINQFDNQIIEKISEVADLQFFIKNDIIIDLGEELKYMPLLIDGTIKVLREDTQGDELLLYILEAGDTCAMSLTCCMAKSISKVRAIADTDTRVVMIPITNMREWYNTNESWRNFILQSYQVRFNEMLETIDALAFLKMDERLFKYLTDLAKISNTEHLEITHKEIAEDLHTSRVVISRLLKQLENEEKIKLGRNKITLLQLE